MLRWYLLLASHPGVGLRWLRTLNQPAMLDYAVAHPPLLQKPLRPYISRHWTVDRRCKVIADTHRVVDGHPELRRALLLPGSVRLIHGALDGGMPYEVRLCRDQQFRKEGELVLALHDSWQGRPLYVLALSFEFDADGSLRCYIGNAQGREQSGAAIKAVSKAFHGMRPPALLLHIARQLATRVGATVLLGASNAIHVHARKHLIHIPRLHRLHFDYDQLWQELGGWLDSDGWYRLSLDASRRERSSLPARKRAQYERRYEWLDRMNLELQQTLQAATG